MSTILNIEHTVCRMGKISNNLEKHGDEDVPAFAIPITGVMLTRDQLNDFLDDKHADRSLYNFKRDLAEPMPWCGKVGLSVANRYEAAQVTIRFSSDEETDDGMEFSACRIGSITLEPMLGGLTRMDFQLQLIPGLGDENLQLQEHQNHEIWLTIADAKVALKKGGKQQDLPLPPPDQRPPVGGLGNGSEATH